MLVRLVVCLGFVKSCLVPITITSRKFCNVEVDDGFLEKNLDVGARHSCEYSVAGLPYREMCYD